jgi:CheY-like chemotaxis protein
MAASCNVGNERNILVADDDENDVFLLRHAFQKAGLRHKLIHLRDGQETIDYLSANASSGNGLGKPDLLLLDLKMPLVDGFDVLVWLQSLAKENVIPVVVFSSSVLASDKQKARELGALDYLAKPTGMEKLTALAQDLHERWLKAA